MNAGGGGGGDDDDYRFTRHSRHRLVKMRLDEVHEAATNGWTSICYEFACAVNHLNIPRYVASLETALRIPGNVARFSA